VAQVSVNPADSPGSVGLAGRSGGRSPLDGPGPNGPIERLMSWLIRKLAWSRLSDPKVAMSVSGAGLLLSMVVGASAHNVETMPVRLPFDVLPSLYHEPILAAALLYIGNILACLGLAGMLWAHSQGWRPDPRKLLLASTGIVAVMVSLTPVGSSDTASYAMYGRIASQGGDPYTVTPSQWVFGLHHLADRGYFNNVGVLWHNQPSVYGPIATAIQSFAAWIGGANAGHTIWVLMILNGLVFIGIGVLLLKTSDDPVRATLFWVANAVLIQQLVSGGHLDTFVAAAGICAIQVARRVSGKWGDVLIGVLIGVACGVKITAVLIALGLAWPLLMRREWMRTARIAAVALLTVALEYSYYGLSALKPLLHGSQWVQLPSPWWFVQEIGEGLGLAHTVRAGQTVQVVGPAVDLITVLWPIAMIVVAWIIYQRISSDQPREIVAPFALSFAWILVAPWQMAWYAAIAWVTLTQVPRNRMTRWLAIVTVFLAIWHSSGGQPIPGQL
jgi:Glycosyltransferase family 87